MADAERDLGTRVDWIAVDHWNTDNPHVHVLVRGRADDGQDLVISRDYISRGLRNRAAERVTLELGPRSEREIGVALRRAMKQERMGLAEPVGPACWTFKSDIEKTLRDLSIRGDIIKTMHRAMSAGERTPDVAEFAIHGEDVSDRVLGKLVERGLHDELEGSAYAIVEGADGRALDQKLGQHVSGTMLPGGGVEWSFGRARGLGL